MSFTTPTRKLTYILVNVKIDTSYRRITANGYTAEAILNRRVGVRKDKDHQH